MFEVEEPCSVAFGYSSLPDHGNADPITRVFVGLEIRHYRVEEV
jgi:hypothetical protein